MGYSEWGHELIGAGCSFRYVEISGWSGYLVSCLMVLPISWGLTGRVVPKIKWLSIWAMSVILLNDIVLSSTLVIILRRHYSVTDFNKSVCPIRRLRCCAYIGHQYTITHRPSHCVHY